jgi:hypothetical protein
MCLPLQVAPAAAQPATKKTVNQPQSMHTPPVVSNSIMRHGETRKQSSRAAVAVCSVDVRTALFFNTADQYHHRQKQLCVQQNSVTNGTSIPVRVLVGHK